MRGISRSGVVAAFAAAAAAVIVVTGQQPESLSVTPVKDGLYYINGVGGNVGVRVTSEGVILVDDKFPRNVDGIKARVAEVTDQPIRYVINTHHHGDHAGGNVGFIDSADVIAHENARRNMIRNEQDAPPRIVYTDQTAVHLGGVEVRAHHLGPRTHQRRLGRLLSRTCGRSTVATCCTAPRRSSTTPTAAAAWSGSGCSTAFSRSTSIPPFPATAA